MPNDGKALIGKQVKDMYGTFVGRVLGTITNIDGSIQAVGVDCGSQGLKHIPFEQLVIQDDVVIFVPKWRLESQRLVKEKELTLRRLKAMIDIASDYDDVKEDTAIIHEKYKSNLTSLDDTEKQIKAKLDARLEELTEQMKSVKMFDFDAKVQFNSNEISEETYLSVKKLTNEYIEHITHESAEIKNMQRRIADLNLEVQQATESPEKQLQESAETYLDSESGETTVLTKLPEAPTEPVTEVESQEPETESESEPQCAAPIPQPVNSQPISEPPQETPTEPEEKKSDESDWLARMEAQ